MDFLHFIAENFNEFLTYTGFANATAGNLIMIAVGALFIWLAIKKDFEPLLLVPIGLGIILGNIPFRADAGLEIGLYEDNSVLNIFYQGVRQGWYPPLIFLGIGAMTDFSALLANPKLMLIGASAQFGIFGAYMFALLLGFEPNQAAGIAIIGGADGPTAIFLSSKLSPNLMGAIAVCAYSYMALVPLIQPPLMRLLTTKKERVIKMKPARQVSQTERILFHFPFIKIVSQPHGCHCCLCLLLHGSCSTDSATIDASAYHQKGARHQDEASASGKSDRAYSVPNRWIASHHIPRAFRPSSFGYALLR